MTDAQIFQLAGITLFPMGLAWVINPKGMRATLRESANSRAFLLLAGMSAIVIGYLILTFRSSWSSSSAAIITILGWVSLIKGLVIIILSAMNIHPAIALVKIKKYFLVMPWLVLFVGIIALYFGYLA